MKCLLNKLAKHVQTPVTIGVLFSQEKSFILIPNLTSLHFSKAFSPQVTFRAHGREEF